MASQLGLYNNALTELGHDTLATVTENSPARFALDTVYDEVLADCLESGDWNFAIREVKAAADTSVTENFGFTETIGKPTDWVRTVALCSDENFGNALTDRQYKDMVDYWATDLTPIYVAYVSNNASYGGNLTAWPSNYRRYVELCLAERVCLRVTDDKGLKDALSERYVPRSHRLALSRDARNEGQKYRKRSTWNDARRSGRSNDRGSRSSLIG